jgi:4-hydroxy-3-polyprenylbenzoate decarboxylase
MTGASGLPYAFRLVEVLLRAEHAVDLMATEAACLVAGKEMRRELKAENPKAAFEALHNAHLLKSVAIEDISGCHASGSSAPEALVVVPCSMNSLARLAAGLGERAHERCAEVMLKENRPLVVVPREMPLSLIDLRNMTRLKEAGALLCPACPGFWHRPQRLEDLVDFVVQKICRLLRLDISLIEAWRG